MDLMEMLPDPAYSGERHVKVLQDALGNQVRILQRARDDLFLQLRPATATWGMAKYEADYGIKPDLAKELAVRLAAWRAKRRGRGTATLAMIKTVSESFAVGPVEVIEHNDEYWFEIKISMRHVIRPQALIDALEEIKPAHLAYLIMVNAKHTADVSLHIAAAPRILTRISVQPLVPVAEPAEASIYTGVGLRYRQKIRVQEAR